MGELRVMGVDPLRDLGSEQETLRGLVCVGHGADEGHESVPLDTGQQCPPCVCGFESGWFGGVHVSI